MPTNALNPGCYRKFRCIENNFLEEMFHMKEIILISGNRNRDDMPEITVLDPALAYS